MRGFTLIEIIISTGIIALLLTLTLVNFRGGEKQYTLDQAAQKLAQDIHRVQNLSLAPQKFGSPPQNPDSFRVTVLPTPGDRYLLVADFPDGSSAEIDRIDFLAEGKITISQVRSGPNPRPNISISFSPPDAIVGISGGGNYAEIDLRLKSDPSKLRTVTVNSKGLIEIR